MALRRWLFEPLTYSSAEPVCPGQMVHVPLGPKNSPASGVVLGPDPKGHEVKNLKAIQKIEKGFPPLSKERLQWIQWLGRYYHYPAGLVAAMAFPPLPFKEEPKKKKAPAGLSDLARPPAAAARPLKERAAGPGFAPTPEQKRCAEAVLKNGGFRSFLLWGVTGSGKTEVYKMIAKKVLSRGRQALIMLPEIFLTPQILQRFSEAFPGQTAVLHSGLSPRQKTRVFQSLLAREKNLLVGTRSALFCPLPRLGLIVIDEEHDSSYKQEDKLPYHARDSALMLAKMLSIPIALGSATPSLSSFYQARQGRHQLLRLKKRALNQPLPKVSLIDMKAPQPEGHPFWLSKALRLKIEAALGAGRQAALFLNRRGKAAAIICLSCGHAQKCQNCDISLTLHGDEHLLCHYCGYMEKKPRLCPACGQDRLFERGMGTEGIERGLKKIFPKARIIRADRDAIDSRAEMEAFIKIVERREADLIIGTQMISKGLDFPSIALVGLVLADMGFHLPDFRASEKTMQLILQMAGRAGRKDAGEAAIQTFQPLHPSLALAQSHDYHGFAEKELKSRQKLFYPPFSRLCLFRIESSGEAAAEGFARGLGRLARKLSLKGMAVLGPCPAPLFKIKNRYRFQLLVKAESHGRLQSFLDAFLKSFKAKPHVQVKTDRDPVSMM